MTPVSNACVFPACNVPRRQTAAPAVPLGAHGIPVPLGAHGIPRSLSSLRHTPTEIALETAVAAPTFWCAEDSYALVLSLKIFKIKLIIVLLITDILDIA
jgi:hypothetical protein